MSKAKEFLSSVNEIRNLRNFWITLDVEGRSPVSAGPKSSNGQATVEVLVRENGSSKKAIEVECLPQSDGKTNLIRVIANGKTIFEKKYER